MVRPTIRLKEGEPCCVCPCPCAGLIDIIGKKWALCVLAQLGNEGTLRFNRLAQGLSGISAKTLTDVLKDLRKSGLVKREAFAETPPRVEYHLTKEGRELTMLVAPLMVWADRMTGLVQLDR
jgi:DNA-binding HxlR family transcriptional regulator